MLNNRALIFKKYQGSAKWLGLTISNCLGLNGLCALSKKLRLKNVNRNSEAGGKAIHCVMMKKTIVLLMNMHRQTHYE